jgi:biopolymer transport protein ExbD
MQKSMAVPKPKDDRPSSMAQPEPQENDVVALTIHVDNLGAFRLENEDGDLEEAPSEQELVTKLRQARSIAGSDASITVMVKANGEAPHYRVVMAIDSAATAGFGKIGLETVEENE